MRVLALSGEEKERRVATLLAVGNADRVVGERLESRVGLRRQPIPAPRQDLNEGCPCELLRAERQSAEMIDVLPPPVAPTRAIFSPGRT